MKTPLQQARHLASKFHSLTAAEHHLNSIGIPTYGIVYRDFYSYVDTGQPWTVIQIGDEFSIDNPEKMLYT